MATPKLPDFRTMLPSQAKREVHEFLVKQFEESKLNCYADPSFCYADALALFRDTEHEWVRTVLLYGCFETAKQEYERRNFKGWNNETQRAYRYKP